MIKLPLKEGEKIVLLLRRHSIVLFRFIFFLILLGGIPIILYFIFKDYIAASIEPDGFLYIFLLILASLYYLYIWLFFFHAWVDYYLDVWIVTTERIISIEQEGLFSHTMSEQRLFRVQDVTSETKGFWPSVFHYGNVYIQSAGEEQRFVFEQVAHPYEISRKILDLHDEDVLKSQKIMAAEEKLKQSPEESKETSDTKETSG